MYIVYRTSDHVVLDLQTRAIDESLLLIQNGCILMYSVYMTSIFSVIS